MRVLVKAGYTFPYKQMHLPDDADRSLCTRVVAGENGWAVEEIEDRRVVPGLICHHCRRKHWLYRDQLGRGRVVRAR